jgi:hypothetical protein
MDSLTVSQLFSYLTNTPIHVILSTPIVQWVVTAFLLGLLIYAVWYIQDIVFGVIRKSFIVVMLGCLIMVVSTTVWRPQVLWGKNVAILIDQTMQIVSDVLMSDSVTGTLAQWCNIMVESVNGFMSSESASTAKQHFQTVMQNLTKQA